MSKQIFSIRIYIKYVFELNIFLEQLIMFIKMNIYVYTISFQLSLKLSKKKYQKVNILIIILLATKESRAGPGGGVKGRAIKEKITFLEPFFPTFQRPLSQRRGGGLGLNGPAIKRRTFFAASLRRDYKMHRCTKIQIYNVELELTCKQKY